jgi:hypothetical protein
MLSRSLTPLVLAGALLASSPLSAATLLPDFGAARFLPGAAIDNPYFPVAPGASTTLVASGTDDGSPFEERTVRSTLGAGPVILGIGTTSVRDRAFVGGLLVEETFDYYAQDSAGNVWYFGEDVTNYHYDEDGNLTGTDSASAWRAGVEGALPGWIMPADPSAGLAYFQEFAAANGALDQAVMHALGQTLTIGGQTYGNVLVTFETTELDPTARELKYYAPGIGLIRAEEGVDAAFGNPALTFDIVPAPVPVPASLALLLPAFLLVGIVRRPFRRSAPGPAR